MEEETTNEENGREYLTKDYIRRAKAKYYNKKKENDIDFREKEKERLRKWQEENREKINEKARIRWQERKKQAKGDVAISASSATDVITEKLEKVGIAE